MSHHTEASFAHPKCIGRSSTCQCNGLDRVSEGNGEAVKVNLAQAELGDGTDSTCREFTRDPTGDPGNWI